MSRATRRLLAGALAAAALTAFAPSASASVTCYRYEPPVGRTLYFCV